MEKLQLALDKARKKRADTGPASPAPRGAAPAAAPSAPRGAAPTAARWQALNGFTPDRAALRKQRIVSLDSDDAAGHFDLLRTKVLLQMRKQGWKRLAITSPTSACGKSMTACNLAAGFTRQADKRVILIEADLRQPTVAKLFGVTPEKGVADVLNGETTFADQALRLGENVAISMNAGPTRDPSQLLMRDATAHILDEIQTAYEPDLVIFDLPPMLAADDTTAFLKNVDCALLIAGAEKTTISQVDTCEREIAEHTNVLGVVLNKTRFVDDDFNYGYYSD